MVTQPTRGNPEMLTVLDRIRKQHPTTPSGPNELDVVVNQLLIPLFQRHGVQITSTKDGDEWVLRVKHA